MSEPLQLGYNSNGLSGLHASEAVELLAGIGYDGIAITLDRGFLNPLDARCETELAGVKASLERFRFRCVIETGARFLLDSQVKHEPTLVSPAAEGRSRRVDFLRRAVDIAAELRADCVSLWSGAVRDGAGDREAMERLIGGLVPILEHASIRGVLIGFEPEPGMLIDTLSRFGDLVDELEERKADVSRLRLTVDIGHLHCQGEVPIVDEISRWRDSIVNIHLEDMRAGIHEHLMFGEGEIDFPPVIAILSQIGYAGLVNVELSRHGQDALAARRAYNYLRPLVDAAARKR
jgi:sugar phosphate isomerase/epimerase